jgi:hypothetical protein
MIRIGNFPFRLTSINWAEIENTRLILISRSPIVVPKSANRH